MEEVNADRRRAIVKIVGLSSIVAAPGLLSVRANDAIPANGTPARKVRILSLQTPTPTFTVGLPRKQNESIVEFARHEIHRRLLVLTEAMQSSLGQLKNDPFHPYVTFFTAPEVYWNVPWTSVRNEAELRQLSNFYLTSIKENIQQLMRKFPASLWGKLILLPGTNAILVPSQRNASRYDAINYLLSANNFGPGTPGDAPYVSIWPKRYTAGIDFLGLSVDINVEGEDETIVYTYQLSSALSVEVYELSTATAQHDTRSGYAPLFDNAIVPSVPFRVSICADFGIDRQEELIHSLPKLEFLIAAGQPVRKGYELQESLQYVIRNDGMAALPQCEVWRVTEGKTSDLVPGIRFSKNVWLHQIVVA